MGGAGAQRELFKAIIEHALPLFRKKKSPCSSTWATIKTTGNGCKANWPSTKT
jgi:hypothetical protein